MTDIYSALSTYNGINRLLQNITARPMLCVFTCLTGKAIEHYNAVFWHARLGQGTPLHARYVYNAHYASYAR